MKRYVVLDDGKAAVEQRKNRRFQRTNGSSRSTVSSASAPNNMTSMACKTSRGKENDEAKEEAAFELSRSDIMALKELFTGSQLPSNYKDWRQITSLTGWQVLSCPVITTPHRSNRDSNSNNNNSGDNKTIANTNLMGMLFPRLKELRLVQTSCEDRNNSNSKGSLASLFPPCSFSRNLKCLELHHCSLGEHLPIDTFANLTELKVLRITGFANFDDDHVPWRHMTEQLKNLQELALQGDFGGTGNLLTPSMTSLPKSICNFPNLCTLNLTSSRLESLPVEISNLAVSLRTLNLSWCRHLCHIPAEIGMLSELETLLLHRCESLSYIPKQLVRCRKLKELNLFGCHRLDDSAWNMAFLQDMPMLETLSIEPKLFSSCRTVGGVCLSPNNVLGATSVGVGFNNDDVDDTNYILSQTTVQTLNIGGWAPFISPSVITNQLVRGLSPSSRSMLPDLPLTHSLKHISLRCDLDEEHLKALWKPLGKCRSLTSLDLGFNNIESMNFVLVHDQAATHGTHPTVRNWEGPTSLFRLNLYGNPVTKQYDSEQGATTKELDASLVVLLKMNPSLVSFGNPRRGDRKLGMESSSEEFQYSLALNRYRSSVLLRGGDENSSIPLGLWPRILSSINRDDDDTILRGTNVRQRRTDDYPGRCYVGPTARASLLYFFLHGPTFACRIDW